MPYSTYTHLELPFLDGIHIDVSKIEHTLQTDQFLRSFKGTCDCSIFSTPETCWCLEMHTPRWQLIAKWNSYRNYPEQYESLYYGDVSN